MKLLKPISTKKFAVWVWISLFWGGFPVMVATQDESLSAGLRAFDPSAVLVTLALWAPGVAAIRLWIQDPSFTALCRRMGLELE
jgi:hypothetical protein